jgi:hypothetical protein
MIILCKSPNISSLPPQLTKNIKEREAYILKLEMKLLDMNKHIKRLQKEAGTGTSREGGRIHQR